MYTTNGEVKRYSPISQLTPFLDGDNSRKRCLSDLKTLLESGYQKYNKNDQAFKITIPVGGYSVKYRVVHPKSHIEEIKHLLNNVFSWQLASRVIFAQDGNRGHFLAELTREAKEAVDDDGQSINLDKLLKLDCFLKESQRLSPVFLLTINRILTQDYEFKCSGLKLPKETLITVPATAIATNPGAFREPNTFDGHRYMRLREEHKESASSLVLGMSTIDSVGFGLGNQACPGRFLAVNNLKLMMAKLMTGWKLTLENNGREFQGPRPSMQYKDFSVVPPSQFSIRLRKL